ncbi:MAG TPA: hypothetical protein VFZ53_20225 [Polyangiaceae bacterium]
MVASRLLGAGGNARARSMLGCVLLASLGACGGKTELDAGNAVAPPASLARVCPAPETVVLVREDEGFHRLALDATHVYWTTDRKVRRVAKCGGAPETVATLTYAAFDLDVARGFVYFAEPHFGGGVRRVATRGGAISEVFVPAGPPRGVLVAGGFAYATTLVTGSSFSELEAVRIDGGEPFTRFKGNGYDVAADDEFVYASAEATNPSDRAIVRLAHADGNAEVLVSPAAARDLAVDRSHVYWLEPSPGGGQPIRIRSAPKSPGAPITDLAVSDTYALRIAADPLDAREGGRVYFTNHTEGTVLGVAKRGGPLVTISTEAPIAEDLRADESSVYFVSFRDGTISRRDAPP